MQKPLLVILLLISFFRAEPAKADFGGTAFIIGIVVGIVAAEISHNSLDKKGGDDMKSKTAEDDEFFNLDLSKTALEDLKLKAVGRNEVE
jgi:hypothetical protein